MISILAGVIWFAPARTYTPKTIELGAMPTRERWARGREIASVLCTQCHLDPDTGKLSGRPMAKVPLGETWSSNITEDPPHRIGEWTDGQIAYALRTGLTPSGRFAAPGMPKLTLLSDEDMLAVIAFLRSGDPLVARSDAIQPPPRLTFLGKAVLRFAMKPAPCPSSPVLGPNDSDATDEGRYLVQAVALGWRCHSASYETHDEAHPERSKGYLAGGTDVPDSAGRPILSPNLTPDADTGLGRWTEEQFTRALRQGLRPDGVALSSAMPMFNEFSNDEAHAIWSYLRSLSAVKHAVPRSALSSEPGASPGWQAYVKYGCIGCHGETGVHIGDLRRVEYESPRGRRSPGVDRPPQRQATGDQDAGLRGSHRSGGLRALDGLRQVIGLPRRRLSSIALYQGNGNEPESRSHHDNYRRHSYRLDRFPRERTARRPLGRPGPSRAVFLLAGLGHLASPIEQLRAQNPWVTGTMGQFVRFSGAAEVLGSLGLVLPAATRIKPSLTPLAALGLTTVMVLAALTHAARGEFFTIVVNALLGGMGAFVAWGRWRKEPIARRSRGTL